MLHDVSWNKSTNYVIYFYNIFYKKKPIILKLLSKKEAKTDLLPFMECSEGECQWHCFRKYSVPLRYTEPASSFQYTCNHVQHIHIWLCIMLLNFHVQGIGCCIVVYKLNTIYINYISFGYKHDLIMSTRFINTIVRTSCIHPQPKVKQFHNRWIFGIIRFLCYDVVFDI